MTKPTCTVDDCAREVLAKNMCSAHYQRAKRGMSLDAKPLRGSVITEVCIIEGCGRATHLRGWCSTHYERWRSTGSAGGPIEDRRPNSGECAVDACERPAKERGWCMQHYKHWWTNGAVQDRPIWTNNWKGDDVTYSGIHMRLKRERGDAADFGCVDCGLAARHWSYDNEDPSELVDSNGLRYSVDANRYDPRCASCHYWYDREHALRCDLAQVTA